MSGVKTNLTADLVKRAAMEMRKPVGVVRERPGADTRAVHEPPAQIETIFRGSDGEIAFTHDDCKADKRYGWLEIQT